MAQFIELKVLKKIMRKLTKFKYWARGAELQSQKFAHFRKKSQNLCFFVPFRIDFSGVGDDIDVDIDFHP